MNRFCLDTRTVSRLLVVAFGVSLTAGIAASDTIHQRPLVLPASGMDTTILEAVNHARPDRTHQQLIESLGNPVAAEHLIDPRLAPEDLERLNDNDPDRVLHRYLVLIYQDELAGRRAWPLLSKHPGIDFLAENRAGRFSDVHPVDPRYKPNFPTEFNAQWSFWKSRLGFQRAWEKVRGHATVAILDNGIQTSPLHPDLADAFRPHYTYNAFNKKEGTVAHVDERFQINGQLDIYAGHGTHVAGIVAAQTALSSVAAGYPNPPAVGTAGICWRCSLMIAKVGDFSASPDGVTTESVTRGIDWAMRRGAQLISMSLSTGSPPSCMNTPAHPLCLAIEASAQRDVVLVAASGNENQANAVNFPASHPAVIPVGGTDYSEKRWTEPNNNVIYGSNGGQEMISRGFTAPAKNVLSTTYGNYNWNPEFRCGDDFGTEGVAGYGLCTGTSMATPHIAGLLALMRTANPLLSRSQLLNALRQSGSNKLGTVNLPNASIGHGIPDSMTAVNQVLTASYNRLSPLFSFSFPPNDLPQRCGNVYTTSPQLAMAIRSAGLAGVNGSHGALPSGCGKGAFRYFPGGTGINEYTNFPVAGNPPTSPKARIWLFTTHVNPKPGPELMPVYHLTCVYATCGHPPNGVDETHAYTSSLAERQLRMNEGFKYQGVIGYVYPSTVVRPAGAIKIYAGRKQGLWDILLENEYVATDYKNVSQIGFAYKNNGPRPSVQ